MSQRRSLEQARAKAAWEFISGFKGSHPDKDEQAKMRSLALGAPAEIQMIGLGQALAFWRAKANKPKEKHHTKFYESVSSWVKRRIGWSGNDSLLEWVVNTASTSDYRRATIETLAFIKWLKYFAEGELEKSKA
ncbi:MAG: type III-B CRISPR module-associated protein Cmr5 [Anaerolineales bacterium]|nr:type III-B CRISPR module-associated protein Cmr5 [Anaerolineales bacterium]